MAHLDIKEKLLLNYVLKYLILPGVIIIGTLHKLRCFLERGGLHTALLAFFGIVSALRVVVSILYQLLVWLSRLRNKPKNKDLVARYGKWAIITGSTSGIGESFADKLASRGMNLLLISRNEQKLKQTASKIQNQHPSVEVQYVVRDFSQQQHSFESQLDCKLQELVSSSDGNNNNNSIGILINAVGVANTIPSLLHKTPIEDLEKMLQINNDGTLQMTMAVLPYMIRQKSGAIITVSSGSCIHPTPMLSIYSATKAFGHTLTRGLYDFFNDRGDESGGGGIDCLSLRPYYFVSNMFSSSSRTTKKAATFLIPFPDVITTAALDVLGYEGDAAPYWAHDLGAILSKWTPHDPAEKILVSMQRTRARQLLRRKKARFAEATIRVSTTTTDIDNNVVTGEGESAAWR